MWRDIGGPPNNRFVGQGPCALPWVRENESPSHGFAVPAPFRQGGQGDGGRIVTASVRAGLAMTHCKECVGRADVGSELSAASGRGSEVSEWPRSKFPASAVRQRRNFGHRNRIIGPYEVFIDRIS